mgnify:CR=1 FL=1
MREVVCIRRGTARWLGLCGIPAECARVGSGRWLLRSRLVGRDKLGMDGGRWFFAEVCEIATADCVGLAMTGSGRRGGSRCGGGKVSEEMRFCGIVSDLQERPGILTYK